MYTLLTPSGFIKSNKKGLLGGNSLLKIYGRLDCRSAKYWIEKGFYTNHRVFFKDEKTAKKCGYRPCGICMHKEYKKWLEKKHKREEKKVLAKNQKSDTV